MMEGQELIQVLQIDHWSEIPIFLGTVKMLERKTLSVLFTSLMQPIASKRFISLFIANCWAKFISAWGGELHWEGSTINSNSSARLTTFKTQGSSVIDSHFVRKCSSFPLTIWRKTWSLIAIIQLGSF